MVYHSLRLLLTAQSERAGAHFQLGRLGAFGTHSGWDLGRLLWRCDEMPKLWGEIQVALGWCIDQHIAHNVSRAGQAQNACG